MKMGNGRRIVRVGGAVFARLFGRQVGERILMTIASGWKIKSSIRTVDEWLCGCLN